MNAEEKHDLALSVRHLAVRYRRRAKSADGYWALKDVSFDLFHGETLGIIGRNGVGKSTLLRVLAGIIAPDKGEIINNAGRVSLLSLQVGFLDYLTGRENAMLSGMLLGMKRRDLEHKLEEIIDFSGIGEFIDEPVGTYSSGMRARLGFAVSFQADPDILLLDEVLGVGDSDFKEKSTTAMKERIRSDRTVVIVSHNITTISDLCDRVVWLEQGETVAEGDTRTILQAYAQANERSKQKNLKIPRSNCS